MKNFLQPKDLIGLEDVTDRGDTAIWVNISFENEKIPSYKCSECGDFCLHYPTAYCSKCGSLMLNYPIAFKTFKNAIDCMKAERKAKENDVQRN